MKIKIISKNIISIVSLASSAILFSQTSLAFPNPQPERCPDVAAIKSVGISSLEKDNMFESAWVGHTLSSYHTKNLWRLSLVAAADGQDEAQARMQAQAVLPTLSFVKGPYWDQSFGVWVCDYHTSFGSAYTETVNLE